MAAQVPVLDSVCTGAVRNYGVDGEAGSTYSWILTPPAGPGILLPSDADTLQMIWNYAAGNYELDVVQHALNGCDADTVSGQVIIFEGPDVSAGPDDQVCVGRYYKLMASTAAGCSSLQWITSGDGTFDYDTVLHPAYTPGANDILAGTVTLTLIGVGVLDNEGACDPSVSSLELAIVSAISPQFEPVGPLCLNSIPPALPDTSLEGITGTWTPPTISTGILGTFPYTFRPNDPAQCGVDTTIQITITDQIVPAFDPIGPLCINSIPPALPDTSLNGITGTWDPDTVDTSIPGTFTYIFTPNDSTQCGVDTTMDIAVVTQINPLFEPIGPLCQYSLPPALPDTSLEGISGTWEPPVIITTNPGIFSFTFTPDSNQCGLDTTIAITILPQVIPVFEPIGPLCQYSASPALPDTSLNGIHGIWNPPVIITAWTGTFTYTFIPDDPAQCGIAVNMPITILPEIIPEFDPIGPLCLNSTPPILPPTSLNGISGTWNPPAISTDQLGNFFYTFSPDGTVPCTMDTTLAITILPETTPVFDSIGPLCLNSIPPALPDTSLNGISGTWIPDTISTASTGTFTYTFTPDPGQCALVATLDIKIITEITPEFAQIGPLCQYSVPPALPDTSLNGIAGTWNPAVINTNTIGTFTYIFSPGDPGQCGEEVTMEITITTEITPIFDQIGPLCLNSPPPLLPAISDNIPAITGTWDPAVINTSAPGISTYTFTPDAGQCAVAKTMNIEITDNITPLFDQIGPLCLFSEPPALPDSSQNVPAITGTWNPAVINTSTTGISTYTFTPDAGQCAVAVTMDIEITSEITPLFEQIGPLCQNSPPVTLPTSSDNIPAITGSWDPSVINTSIPGIVTYTFTPDEGQCGSIVTMDVEVTAQIIPLFDPIGPLSQNTIPPALPDTSLSGITGTWDPDTIDTSIPGTYAFTFTPDTGQCAVTTGMNITILFDYLQAITGPGKHCLGDAAIVPVEVDKFTGVAVFQLKLSFNTDKLFCEGYINLNPLLADHFTGWIDNLNGIITLTWQSAVPLTFDGLTTVCDLVFTPKEPGQGQLAWYTGATESYFHDLSGGSIPAQFLTDDMTIYQPPEILLPQSKSVCSGQQVTIVGIATSTYPPITYKWTYPNGDTTTANPSFASVTQADAGDYTLLATDSLGCTDQKTIQLVVGENPVTDFHGTDTLAVMPGYILEAGSGFDSYQWNTGETSEAITIDTTGGWYWVRIVTDVGCTGIDSVYIVITEVPENCLYIPNAFTPNNDGHNDTFKPVSGCPDLEDYPDADL